MTEEDLRQLVKEFRAFVAAEFETLHQRLDSMEAAMLKMIRSLVEPPE